MEFLFILFLIIFLHALYNLINYLRYPIIEKNLLYNYSSNTSDKMVAVTHKNQVLNYIKHAGVKDKFIPVTQATGYGQIATASISVFDNILNQRQDVAQIVLESLLEAKGNYWSKFVNSFNPFFWLRIIIFIPKYLFSYLGLKEESIVIKIFQILYWIIAVISTFLITIFPEEIKEFIFSIIHFS